MNEYTHDHHQRAKQQQQISQQQSSNSNNRRVIFPSRYYSPASIVPLLPFPEHQREGKEGDHNFKRQEQQEAQQTRRRDGEVEKERRDGKNCPAVAVDDSNKSIGSDESAVSLSSLITVAVENTSHCHSSSCGSSSGSEHTTAPMKTDELARPDEEEAAPVSELMVGAGVGSDDFKQKNVTDLSNQSTACSGGLPATTGSLLQRWVSGRRNHDAQVNSSCSPMKAIRNQDDETTCSSTTSSTSTCSMAATTESDRQQSKSFSAKNAAEVNSVAASRDYVVVKNGSLYGRIKDPLRVPATRHVWSGVVLGGIFGMQTASENHHRSALHASLEDTSITNTTSSSPHRFPIVSILRTSKRCPKRKGVVEVENSDNSGTLVKNVAGVSISDADDAEVVKISSIESDIPSLASTITQSSVEELSGVSGVGGGFDCEVQQHDVVSPLTPPTPTLYSNHAMWPNAPSSSSSPWRAGPQTQELVKPLVASQRAVSEPCMSIFMEEQRGSGGSRSSNSVCTAGVAAVSFCPRILIREFERSSVHERRDDVWYNERDLERFKIEAMQHIRRFNQTALVPTGTGRMIHHQHRQHHHYGQQQQQQQRFGFTINRRTSRYKNRKPGILFSHQALRSGGCSDEGDEQNNDYDENTPGNEKEHHTVTKGRHTTTGGAHPCDGWAAKERYISAVVEVEIRNILIVDPHDICLKLFSKALKQLLPHASIVTATSSEIALKHIDVAGTSSTFDVIIVEERLGIFHRQNRGCWTNHDDAGPCNTDSNSSKKHNGGHKNHGHHESGSELIVEMCERSSLIQSRTLLIGVSAHIHEDHQRLTENGNVDLCWTKPPPLMNEALRNTMLRHILAKRGRTKIVNELFTRRR